MHWWPHLFTWPRFLDPVSWFWLSSRGYAFTSSGLQLTIPAALLIWLRKHNCHVRWCWRLQWRKTDGGDYVCRYHHPVGPKSHAQVLEDHYKGGDPDGPD